MELVSDIRELPALGDDQIHIWGVHLPDVVNQCDALYAWLSDAEQQKATRFLKEADKQCSIVARGALRVLLSGYTGIPASELEFVYSDNGKPSLLAEPGKAVSFNLSHAVDWVVLAFGRERDIGVDVEKIRPSMDVNTVADRFFTPAECAYVASAPSAHAAFFQLWAYKEAYIKARGSALFQELSSYLVPVLDEKTLILSDQGEKDGWFFERLEAGSKYAAAVVSSKPWAATPCYNFGEMKWAP